jgi:hypothetical protein
MAQANQNVLDRHHSMNFSVSPEERQLLGITDEDIASFYDENLLLTPREIQENILSIIEGAYEEVPAFKALVDSDAIKDPNRLGRSAKVVDKLLMHLRGALPPEKKIAIKDDTFLMAHDMIRDTLQGKLRGPQAPAAVPEEQIAPITDSELSLFNLPRTALTEKTKWSDIKDSVLFFLGKLKGPDGKTVKNEATKGMPDDLKIQVLAKLFNDIRQKKLEASGGTLSPSDVYFIGKNVAQLKQIARSMVVPVPGKADPVYQNDLMEMNSQAGEAIKFIDRIQEISKDTKFTDAIDDLTRVLDTALPPVSLFEDRINNIQEEISKLGLSKAQISALTEIDIGSLSYNDPVKKLLDEQKVSLQAVQNELNKSGETPDLVLKRKTIEKQIKQLEDLSGKDTSGLKGAIEDYLSTLRTYKENIKTNISNKKLDETQQKTLATFSNLIDQMALIFSRLAREELLKARWEGRSGFLIRKENKTQPAPSVPGTAVEAMNKLAGDAAGYASKLEKFRGSGLSEAYKEIQDILWGDDKLPAIKGKLIDVLGFQDRIESIEKVFDSGKSPQEIKQEVSSLTQGTIYGSQIDDILNKSDDLQKLKNVITTILKKDRTIVSQREGVSHAEISLSDAVKYVNRLRTLIKKIKIEDKGTEAFDVIQWAAMLQNHIKTGKKPASSVLASAAYYLRKMAARLLCAEDGKSPEHRTYQSPAGVGSQAELKSSGKARPIIFRERITKMGKKALQSFFDEPTFVPDFVEEMEKAGLNRMLVHGSDLKEMDIEPILESVLKKVTGKKGNIENILGTKVMQEYKSKFNIATTEKDLEESRTRVKDLNNKISETEDKYLPKLEDYAQFIKDPIAATRSQLEELRGKGKEKGKREDISPRVVTKEVRPEDISAANYRSVLKQLATKYSTKNNAPDTIEFTESMFKQAKENEVAKKEPSDMSKKLPSEFIKQYMVWKKQLKNIKSSVDREKDSYKKAVELEKYYSFMMTVIQGLSEYLEYQSKVLRADDTMIVGIESFINSDAAKSEKAQFIQESRESLKKLKSSFDQQKKLFDSINKTHTDLSSVEDITRDQLDAIRDDISDKKVDMLYQVAISPDLVPDKETARKIKEQAKEHEKGLSFIIDRSTYKNNMNRLMTYKLKHRPFQITPGGDVTILGPERKKEFEQKLRESEELARKMKNEADSGMREIAYKKLESDLVHVKSSVEESTKLVETYEALIENIDYLSANKDTMDPSEYGKQVAALNALLKTMHLYKEDSGKDVNGSKKDVKTDKENLKITVQKEKEYLTRATENIKILEGIIEQARKEIETKLPPVNVDRQVEQLLQRLYRIRLMVQHNVDKPYNPREEENLLEDKIKQLHELESIPVNPVPGTSGELAYKRFKKEFDHQLDISTRDLEDLKKKNISKNIAPSTGAPSPVTPMVKTAAIEDTMPDLSPYEKALETKGIKPAPFMQELPKPKGWDIVENFFKEVKREYNFFKSRKEEGKDSPLQSQYLKNRLDQLENMAGAIDAYKNQKVTIGGDSVVFRDVMMEFEKTLTDYQDLLTKYTSQRDAAVDKVSYLQQELDHYNEMYDSETGEFKGLDPEEIANLKDIFLRMLYKDMERYWSSRVGKDLSVFGERDTNWYNNVFSTFKNVAKVRSNKKMLGLINKYKQETRSDFDDMINRTKSQQLEKERDKLLEGYEEYKVDPEISTRLKEFNTRIETLKKQEKQMDRVFNFMGSASLVAMQSDFEKMLREKSQQLSTVAQIEEPLKGTNVKLDDKATEETNKAIDALEEELPVIVEHAKESDLAEKDLKELKIMREERAPVPEAAPIPQAPTALPGKLAFDKTHRDFNLNILYGSHMQSKIAEMLSEELK